MNKYVYHKDLPKSNLINIHPIRRHGWWFRTVRLANAREIWLFKYVWLTVRCPWLRRSAKQLHPELFKEGVL